MSTETYPASIQATNKTDRDIFIMMSQHIMLRTFSIEYQAMLKEASFKNQENERKAALKAEREKKKKEDLRNKNLAHLPEDDLKEALKTEREIRKNSREDKKLAACKKRLSLPYDLSTPTTTPKQDLKKSKRTFTIVNNQPDLSPQKSILA